MRFLAVVVNGILDLKNFYPLSLELMAKHSIFVDIVGFRPALTSAASQYDGLIVGSDWNQNAELVRAFKVAGKTTVLLQSEGMFVEAKKWYVGKAPLTDLACLWGPEHADIFMGRGYNGAMVVTGPPRFDTYYNFRPAMARDKVYETLGLRDPSKPFILYLGQYFPKHEFGSALLQSQIQLTRFAGDSSADYYAIVKSHPQEAPKSYFSRSEVLGPNKSDHVLVADRGSHTEAIEISTLLHFSSGVVTFSSTAAIEAMLLGRPAAVFEGGLSSPLSNGQIARLPTVASQSELLQVMNAGVDTRAFQNFISRFLPGAITGQYASIAASAIATMARDTTKTSVPAAQSAPADLAESDRQISDASAYRWVAIDAYTEVARAIGAQHLNGLSAECLTPFCATPRAVARKMSTHYQELHENDNGYQANNWLVPELPHLIGTKARRILEIGCGNGRFIRAAAEIADTVIGIDFAASPLLKDLPPNVQFVQHNVVTEELPTADLACSADVLEHFTLEEIVNVVRKLHAAAPKQYHLIACYDDGHSHHTIMHPGAWLALFRSFSQKYKIADVRPRRNNPKQLVCVISSI
ncbi:methyltransferase domain-containing protein [Hyphomicrobium sp. CS1BSMeth3]|uniref:methyltransferase domain-containing protein n=1 Tax=Hyphomicrobium sp. CS1BSMeth3 TaxID=1892844 RepID=UPI000930B794|nr:methyltransferase domain-containing protein [Hyphomicrobium sp. CS1BSMeth3]